MLIESLRPSVIYRLGVSWSTDSAVNIRGGGAVSVNSGSMYLDFIAQTATNFQNWLPQVQYTYSVFSTAFSVSWIPIVRSSLWIGANIMNAPYGAQPIYITSATPIGFNVALIETDGGPYTAGELMMTSYSNVANNVVFNGKSPQVLSGQGNVAGSTNCFNIPNDQPPVDEVSSLRSIAAAYCTSYLGHSPPLTIAYGVSTITTPTTIQTTVPTMISTTSTVYT